MCELSKNMVKWIYQEIEYVAYFLLPIKIFHVNKSSTRAQFNKFDLFKNGEKASTLDRRSKYEDFTKYS